MTKKKRLLVVGKSGEALAVYRDYGEELGYEAMASTDEHEVRMYVCQSMYVCNVHI